MNNSKNETKIKANDAKSKETDLDGSITRNNTSTENPAATAATAATSSAPTVSVHLLLVHIW